MKKGKTKTVLDQISEQSQILYIDGCKVSIKYSEQKNPSAVQNIKDALITGGSIKKL